MFVYITAILGLRLTPETMAFSGCSITSGVGKGLVVDTGMSTRSFFAR